MHHEGDIAAQAGSEFTIFGGQQESFRGSVGTLLLSGCVQFLHSFRAVVQHHFAVPLERKSKYFIPLCCMSLRFTENFVELNRAQLLCLNRLPDRMTTDNTSCVKGWDTMGSLIIVAVNKTLPLWLSFVRCRSPGRLQTNKKVTSLWHNKEKWIVMENERSRQKCKYTTFPNWSIWTWTGYIAVVFHLRICRITTLVSIVNWPDMVSIHWLIGGV